jgi:UDP:flavonoid glycosyltransferase YjiC (YdhE family)
MKFALACYGSRGDVEPSVAVGRELKRRGHQSTSPSSQPWSISPSRRSDGPLWARTDEFLNEDFSGLLDSTGSQPSGSLRELWAPIIKYWPETSKTLLSLAHGADLLSTGLNYEQPAANVAEYLGIPLVSLHHFPMRPNSQVVPMLPSPVVRSTGTFLEWLFWRATKKVENEQRAELGLPMATVPPHAGSPNVDQWRSRPMTPSASPASPRNGRGGQPIARSSEH